MEVLPLPSLSKVALVSFHRWAPVLEVNSLVVGRAQTLPLPQHAGIDIFYISNWEQAVYIALVFLSLTVCFQTLPCTSKPPLRSSSQISRHWHWHL